MSDIMRPRYGTKAENDGYIGLDGEISIDRETQHLRIHDGVTAGGAKVVANQDEVEAVRTTAENALPLSGGTMTGAIKTSVGDLIVKTTDDGYLCITGATKSTNGARIVLSGKDRQGLEGRFTLVARDATNESSLTGLPDGTLQWRGKDVITSAGGNFTGDVVVSNTVNIKNANNTGWTKILGGTSTTGGGRIQIAGQDCEGYRGVVWAVARDYANSKECILKLTPNGSATWGGKEVERVNSSGDGYIRYESGIQICWGAYQVSSGTQVSEVIFPVPFLSKSSYVPNANSLTKGNINLICVRDANSANGEKMTVQAYLQGNTSAPTSNYYVAWSARGKWK